MGHIGSHRMPRLADCQGQRNVVPTQFNKGLTEAQNRHRAGEVVEVCLHFSGDAHGAELVAGNVQSKTGGKGHEAPVETSIGVNAFCIDTQVFRHVKVQVLCTGINSAAVRSHVVADETVKFKLGGSLLLRHSIDAQHNAHGYYKYFFHYLLFFWKERVLRGHRPFL